MLFQYQKPYFKHFNLSNSKYTTSALTLFPYCFGSKFEKFKKSF